MSTPASTQLGQAIRAEAAKLATSAETAAVPAEFFDASELLRVLARIVEGKSIDQAFGAPGDWGYGTPIGDASYALLKEPLPGSADVPVGSNNSEREASS